MSRTDIKISPHVMEFVKQNENFSDLQPLEKGEEGIWLSITSKQVLKLKKKIKKVLCQSYLLDGNQYEDLCDEKKEVLLNIEKKFQVKGYPYQIPIVGDIPVIFQLNQLTSISGIVNSDPENILLDCLISVDNKKPQTEFETLKNEKDYKILVNDSWKGTMNDHITLFVKEINDIDTWNLLFEKCLREVSKNDVFPHTIGISIPTVIKNLMKFCEGILTAVNNLPQIYKRPIYILLFVETQENLVEVIKILKKISAANSESERIPSGPSAEGCIVDVIEGYITDQKVNVIVCTSDMSLNLTMGAVASALLKKAGPQLQQDCNESYPNGCFFPEIAVTKGYKLPCDYVYFGALPANDKISHISTFMEQCLQKAADNGVSSIAFPVMGTGKLNYTAQEVASQMDSAITQFMTANPRSSLKKIIIVIFPGSEGMGSLFQLKTKDSKGAALKKEPNTLQQNQQRDAKNWIPNQLQWISFSDYSKTKQLDQAIMVFEKRFLPSPRTLKRNTSTQDQLNQNKPNSSENFEAVNIHSSSVERPRNDMTSPSSYQAAKYDENISSSSDRFLTNKPNSSEFDGASRLSSYSIGSKRTSLFFSNLNGDIDCFKTKDGFVVKIYEGNILKAKVDGIVNAANKWLAHGGGLARAIINAAGDTVDREGQAKRRGRPLYDAEVLSTSAGNLKHYKYIIHAVGPVYTVNPNADDYCRSKIQETVYNALNEAFQLGLHSIAIPAISSGIFGVPLDICTEGYFLGVEEFCKRKPPNCQLGEVHFVDMNSNTSKIIKEYFAKQLDETTMDVDSDNIQHPNYNSSDTSSQENYPKIYHDTEDITHSAYKKPMEHSDIVYGNQPSGTMDIQEISISLLGYSEKNFYSITYSLNSSFRKNKPITKEAFLPATDEGKIILKMLQMAFEQYLIFKENDGHVSWADIPHKENLSGKLEEDGCLSHKYLNEVKDCLAKKGITPESVATRELEKQIVSK